MKRAIEAASGWPIEGGRQVTGRSLACYIEAGCAVIQFSEERCGLWHPKGQSHHDPG
jgi:hypothetical protein